ncbi:unnamed protein product, partial [Polarella glacialis]
EEEPDPEKEAEQELDRLYRELHRRMDKPSSAASRAPITSPNLAGVGRSQPPESSGHQHQQHQQQQQQGGQAARSAPALSASPSPMERHDLMVRQGFCVVEGLDGQS